MSSDHVEVYALHGFLGAKEDWKIVFDFLGKEKPHWKLRAIDLFADIKFPLKSQPTMDEWARQFRDWVKSNSVEGSRKILLGYSMGGRLALHALAQDPQVWSGAVFLSTNPGLLTNDEKAARIESDQKWAQRFAEEEFHKVISDWNAQGVFKGSSVEPTRKLQSLDRGQLVHALTAWSLGTQRNFREMIDLWSVRQIWAAGEKDTKFAQMLATLPTSNEIQKWVVEEASHRLLFEAPQEVAHFVARVGSPIVE